MAKKGKTPKPKRPKDLERLAELGARLKRAREAAGLTQTELAGRADIPARTLVNYEQGRRQPAVLDALDLARAIGVGLDELVGPLPWKKRKAT